MNNWYKVEINGRHNGKPLSIQGTLQAENERDAAYAMVRREFDGGDDDELYDGRGDDGKIHFSWEYLTTSFRTEHTSFAEMAQEITHPAELARLNGDPMLPLEDF